MASAGHHKTPIEVRRAERELFFWTASKALRLVLAITGTVYAIVAIIEGRLPGLEQIIKLVG